ncbi:MAG: hypothetical protein ABJZ55_06820 [Fuerstiella sp.]
MPRMIQALILVVCITGCVDQQTQGSKAKPDGPGKLAKPKTTDQIGEFDPTAENEVVDSEVKISNPITGALEAYGPLKQQISGLAVTQAVEMFRATEGRYPNSHEEFMSKIVAANGIRLPVPGNGLEYQYDVQNHSLVVVRLPK